jgi:prepilin-type N-terminal cleavage/methylation domain-containing protein
MSGPIPVSPLWGVEHLGQKTMLRYMRRHAGARRAIAGRRICLESDAGFTLIELVVTMAILLTVVSVLTGALISATNTEADLNNRFQTQEQARQALTKLTREIHCANQILDTATGSNLGSTPVSAITLTLPAGCPTGGATAVTALWCTVADGSRYDLYRAVAPSSCTASTGVRWASSLVDGTPFSLPDPTTTSGPHFPLIHLNLVVNTRTAGAYGQYDLVDDVAALNRVAS